MFCFQELHNLLVGLFNWEIIPEHIFGGSQSRHSFALADTEMENPT